MCRLLTRRALGAGPLWVSRIYVPVLVYFFTPHFANFLQKIDGVLRVLRKIFAKSEGKAKRATFWIRAQSIRFTGVSNFLSDFSNLATYRATSLLNWRKSLPNCTLTVEILIFLSWPKLDHDNLFTFFEGAKRPLPNFAYGAKWACLVLPGAQIN